ncbi:hypothetical protein K438DRAFT_1962514 [Mycena galopus ATCC 62051]|nr:hypothetical protein K438DRAFT_1962514 [Mycena galopus ATCC 62051]
MSAFEFSSSGFTAGVCTTLAWLLFEDSIKGMCNTLVAATSASISSLAHAFFSITLFSIAVAIIALRLMFVAAMICIFVKDSRGVKCENDKEDIGRIPGFYICDDQAPSKDEKVEEDQQEIYADHPTLDSSASDDTLVDECEADLSLSLVETEKPAPAPVSALEPDFVPEPVLEGISLAPSTDAPPHDAVIEDQDSHPAAVLVQVEGSDVVPPAPTTGALPPVTVPFPVASVPLAQSTPIPTAEVIPKEKSVEPVANVVAKKNKFRARLGSKIRSSFRRVSAPSALSSSGPSVFHLVVKGMAPFPC